MHHLAAVHAGQHHVEHDGVVAAGKGQGQPGLAVVGRLRVAGGIGEDARDGVGEVSLVLDNQNVHGVSSRSRTARHLPLLSYPSALNFF